MSANHFYALICAVAVSCPGSLLADDLTRKSGPGTPAEVQLELGLSSLAKGDLKAADAAFSESLKLNPGLVGSMIGKASVAVQKGDTKEAESYFQQALAKSPQDPAVQRSWSRYLISQRRFGEAESSLKKAIAMAPKQAAVSYTELGNLYLINMNKPADAMRSYRSALALDSSFAEAHYGLGSAMATTGDYTHAEAEFTAAEKVVPTDPMPVQARGVAQMMEKNYSGAVQSFTRALALRPDQIPWLMARAEAYEALGSPNNALKDYQGCVRVDQKYSPAYVKIGVIYQTQNRFADAQKAYESAIAADPKQVFAYNNMAFGLAERKERLDDALKFANKAVELEPQAPQYRDTLAWVRRARGELDQAARLLEQVSATNPPQGEFYYHLGIVYSEQGRNAEASAALKKALSLGSFGEAEDARQRLARLTAK
ncbi:MAG TPA: tetratricopeptide repeat protein [Candidatus Acidoferrales bacterium]|nr:tetratricopeptide repeat protein [Candidatus Acidoferrales bacterium]